MVGHCLRSLTVFPHVDPALPTAPGARQPGSGPGSRYGCSRFASATPSGRWRQPSTSSVPSSITTWRIYPRAPRAMLFLSRGGLGVWTPGTTAPAPYSAPQHRRSFCHPFGCSQPVGGAAHRRTSAGPIGLRGHHRACLRRLGRTAMAASLRSRARHRQNQAAAVARRVPTARFARMRAALNLAPPARG